MKARNAATAAAWITAWKDVLGQNAADGAPPEAFCGANGPFFPLCDATVLERSWRRGLVLLAAENGYVAACLVFRGRVFGTYARAAESVPVETVLRELPEFRLGWLPDEAVRLSGGLGAAFAVLPAEAEGFPIVLICGENRHSFTGHGKIIDRAAHDEQE
ncbi:DUF1786 family protein [Desulfovibrio sp. OttesenSCG-928-O18]|nr:DUF1786 family protein [Desulfovibrio sp. OttesenSCG-928-O18]